MKNKKLLIVVDMQNDFVTGPLGTEEAKAIVSNIANYASKFEGDVVFTQDTHFEDYLDTQEGKHLPTLHCVYQSQGWQLVPELDEIAIARKAIKINKSTFGSPALAKFVQHSHYTSIELCGVCTGICVISNALMLKACCPETPIKVWSNMCACVTNESHNEALDIMKLCHIDVERNFDYMIAQF